MGDIRNSAGVVLMNDDQMAEIRSRFAAEYVGQDQVRLVAQITEEVLMDDTEKMRRTLGGVQAENRRLKQRIMDLEDLEDLKPEQR